MSFLREDFSISKKDYYGTSFEKQRLVAAKVDGITQYLLYIFTLYRLSDQPTG